jgi:sarcosine oxidase subunit beta
MRGTAEAVIIGGGCMGASTAWHLARHGMSDVVLVEREPFLGTASTGRNAGGVRHQFSSEANVQLSIESIRALERFEEELGQAVDFHQDGYLFLLSTEASVEAFRAHVAMQRRLGVEVAWLGTDEAAAMAPGLRVDGVRAATFCARDGIADPNGVTQGFAAAARRLGVEICRGTEATSVRVERGRVAGVETTAGFISTPRAVLATGAYSRAIGRTAGVEVPIDPQRRHIFIASPPEPGAWEREPRVMPASRIMVIDFESTFYFHREGAGVLFGMADREEPTFDTSVNWEFLERAIEVAVARLPALADGEIARAWAGLYEMTPDAMPIIGPAGGVDGLFLIAGFSGHGFQHSPAAGRILADVMAGHDPGFDLAPFAHARFREGSRAGERNVV